MDKKQILKIAVVALAVGLVCYYIYKRHHNNKECMIGDPGSCNLDSDCGGPAKGQCFKENGSCQCVCKPGYSGKNCEINGVPYNSPHCMGPNKQTPGNKDGLCVCPPGKWRSAETKEFGYVQCYGCDTGFGPYPGDNKEGTCTMAWGNANYVSGDCYLIGSSHACDEFSSFNNLVGPGNMKGSVKLGNVCDPKSQNSCRCDPNSQMYGRNVCAVTGWIDPNRPTNETCDITTKERACSSYQCFDK